MEQTASTQFLQCAYFEMVSSSLSSPDPQQNSRGHYTCQTFAFVAVKPPYW